jgi:hypothetical protein
MDNDKLLKRKLLSMLPLLNEKQRRLFLAAEAKEIGYGGISKIAKLANISRPLIHRGIVELDSGKIDPEVVRNEGGGRKSTITQDKKVIKIVEKYVDDLTSGDPMSPLKWVSRTIRHIAEDLTIKNFPISRESIRIILKNLDYSLQGNNKSLDDSHPDRDEQFKHINKTVKKYFKEKNPVISVDAKKKELIGNFENKGKEWRKKNNPRKVKGHDFPEKNQEVGIPYGVYDQANNSGWVNVGCDHDTSAFAVASIERWWIYVGKKIYPSATKLLICADSGGSNGYRTRLWKFKLYVFACKYNLKITICHFPRGTSKWNKIEHRLFSHISMNWKGRPLTSHDVMVKLIGATKTSTGLTVKAKIDKRKYPIGIKVTDDQMEKIKIKKNKFHGDWNYSISPQRKL